VLVHCKRTKKLAPDYASDGPPTINAYEFGNSCTVTLLTPKCVFPPDGVSCATVSGELEDAFGTVVLAENKPTATSHQDSFIKEVDNKIKRIRYEGYCPCWLVLFDGKKWGGSNLAIFLAKSGLSSEAYTQNDKGNIDLNAYMFYNQNTRKWQSWSNSVSSFSIYCHWGVLSN
jgi:hypothetical protein